MISKGKSKHIKVFSALSFCVSLYLFGYLLELNSSSLEQMIFWNQIQYFGLPFFPVLWLIMAMFYTNKINVHKKWTLGLLCTIPILTFLFRITNSFHNLIYSSMQLKQLHNFSILHLERGYWFFVQSGYISICLILTTMVFYWKYKKSTHVDHLKFRVLLVASIIAYVGLILVIIDYMGLGIDYSALTMPISLILIMYAILKYDFLEVKTLARETIFENSSDGMMLLDMNYLIMDYNRAAQQFFSALNISLHNCNFEDILGNQKEMIYIFKSETPQDFKFYQGGQERFFEISTSIIRDFNGRSTGILIFIRDITENKKMQKKLEILAIMDELSGLYNRRQFVKLTQREFEQTRRQNNMFSVLMIDIDNFKSINDAKGHAAGDAVIRKIGKIMNDSFRKTDFCGRLGGEEFAVTLPNTCVDDAKLVAEQFRKKIEETQVAYDNVGINFSVSIGVASYFREAQIVDEILKCADEAMYESKARGKNCTTVKKLTTNS